MGPNKNDTTGIMQKESYAKNSSDRKRRWWGSVLETAAINIYVGYTFIYSQNHVEKLNLSSETLADHVVFAIMKWFVSKVQETECPPHVVFELATRRPITQG